MSATLADDIGDKKNDLTGGTVSGTSNNGVDAGMQNLISVYVGNDDLIDAAESYGITSNVEAKEGSPTTSENNSNSDTKDEIRNGSTADQPNINNTTVDEAVDQNLVTLLTGDEPAQSLASLLSLTSPNNVFDHNTEEEDGEIPDDLSILATASEEEEVEQSGPTRQEILDDLAAKAHARRNMPFPLDRCETDTHYHADNGYTESNDSDDDRFLQWSDDEGAEYSRYADDYYDGMEEFEYEPEYIPMGPPLRMPERTSFETATCPLYWTEPSEEVEEEPEPDEEEKEHRSVLEDRWVQLLFQQPFKRGLAFEEDDEDANDDGEKDPDQLVFWRFHSCFMWWTPPSPKVKGKGPHLLYAAPESGEDGESASKSGDRKKQR